MNKIPNSTSGCYILDDSGNPIPASHLKWGRWFATHNRSVSQTQATPSIRVSTVFLGVDHSWWTEGPPRLWETMIFGGEHDQYQDRYSSLADALEGHHRAVRLARGEATPDE